MRVRSFLDTNLFIYQLEDTDPDKSAIADELITEGIRTGLGRISFQVVQECLNVVLRKAEIPLDTESARRYLDGVLTPLWHVQPSRDLHHQALSLQDRYGYGFYDCVIIAAALASDCSRLYSEDLQHGQRIDRLTIHNPFL